MAILSFLDRASEDINYGRRTKVSLRRLPANPHDKARVKLARLHAAETLEDLASLPGNRFEKLHGDRAEQYGIRVNGQYRICFRWSNAGAKSVEVVDYH